MKYIKISILIAIIVILFILSFVRIWDKPVKTGVIKVNTWTKIQLIMGWIYID